MAEEKTFSVGVQTSSPKRISVTSNVSENPITASADTGLYYSQLAKNWAIGEELIQNEDYSSKTWAGESKSSADLSKMYSEAASLDLTNLENRIIEYDEQLNTTITEGLDNINASVTGGVETIETLQANSIAEITTNKESALGDIGTAETNVLANIDTSKLNTLAQIEELANSSIEDINATGIDTKVSKSGDTMTGSLTVQKAGNANYIVQSTDYAYNEVPTTSAGFGQYTIADKNGDWASIFGFEKYTDGRNLTKMQVKASDGSHARIQIWADKNNQFYCDFPKCTTKATTTSSANSSLVAVIVQNYVSGTSWYRVWSDGWIEQGGRVDTGTGATKQVTFLKPHSNNSYTISLMLFANGSTGDKHPLYINGATYSYLSIRNTNSNGQIAYWRTAGY